ncbi:uncharacterized protein C11orf16 homolog isoform X2 [Coturnix japonica]|uniref:uncharacterized protein C11orf16 homolog isoform X2 n=1 Tax=Coturnix japonica TaxID=93934 RepID=UPI0007771DFE|nr:uncharacterized protein C11orf16 homolog isoform X2 [Coturnix japonica]
MPTSHVPCCHTASQALCGSVLPGCPLTRFPVCAWSPDSICMPLISSARRNFIHSSPEASSFIRGARVLARRKADGYYYLGHIAQEVKGSRECFLIEFDKSRALKGSVRLRVQETPLYDILRYKEASQRSLAPGDRVLAPWDANTERFGPGTVVKVMENKQTPSAHSRKGVLVNFWNGQTKEVSSDQALWIPLPLSERIILELQMPLAARQMVVESSLDYPYIVTPGYRASGRYRRGHSGLDCWPGGLRSVQPCAECSCRCTSVPHCCLTACKSSQPTEHKGQRDNSFIPGTCLSKGKLSKKIEEQLSEVRISPSGSVSREEEENEEKSLMTENLPKDAQCRLEEDSGVLGPKKSPQREMAHATMVDPAVSTDSWLLESVDKEEAGSRQQDAGTEAHLKHKHGLFESRVADAPIQPSQRSISVGASALCPFQPQSFFDQVRQSLKKDSLAIESALRIQRPCGTSSVRAGRFTHLNLLKDKSISKSVHNSASQERWKEMDLSKAKIEHKRRQEEERQLKRRQQQEADAVQRQLRRNNQRIC